MYKLYSEVQAVPGTCRITIPQILPILIDVHSLFVTKQSRGYTWIDHNFGHVLERSGRREVFATRDIQSIRIFWMYLKRRCCFMHYARFTYPILATRRFMFRDGSVRYNIWVSSRRLEPGTAVVVRHVRSVDDMREVEEYICKEPHHETSP